MAKVILGYPGVGLIDWVKQKEDGVAVWADKFDIDELSGLDASVKYYAAPLNDDAIQLCADNKIETTLIYPAPITLGEYGDRQVKEGVTKSDSEVLLATMDNHLRSVRENTSKRNRHIVLGRNEYAYDFLD